MAKRFDRAALDRLSHAEIRARYQAMFGEPPRSPNKTWMLNQMEERHAAAKAEKKGQKKGEKGAKKAARRAPSARAPRSHAPEEEAPESAAGGDEPAARERQEDAARAAPPSPPGEDASDAGAGAATRERGKFRGMTVDELRALYEQKIGRATSSTDKPYLIWKLTQAEKGKIRVGPVVHGQRLAGDLANNDRTLPLTMTAAAVKAIDEAWPRVGFHSRMSFMRCAIREALERRGETSAAGHFPDKGTASA